jgi:hypothetical protein
MDILKSNVQDLWEYLESELPDDLDALALRCGALVRRKGVASAGNLLRVILTYGVTDLSLKAVAAWASSVKLAEFSPVALFFRIRDSREWLSELISTMLNERTRPSLSAGLNVVLVDATCITGPGAKGTEWRLHTQISADTGQISGIKLTDQSVGETYENYPVEKGQVLVGDRAYAMATGIAYVYDRGGYVVARVNLQSIRLCGLNREVFKARTEEGLVSKVGVSRYNVLIPVPPERRTKSHKSWKLEDARDWIPARLLAVRTIKDEVIWVITTVPEQIATDAVIMELFRVRWQIELEFKRLKSLLGLDALPSRRGPTAESWILARILAAILVEKLLNNSGVFSPWGYRLRASQ